MKQRLRLEKGIKFRDQLIQFPKTCWSLILFCLMVSSIFSGLTGCDPLRNEEENTALATDQQVRYDSLFLGIYFNMGSEEFFDYCFEMNQKGLFFQSPDGREVQYKFKDEFTKPVVFTFFPEFSEASIHRVKGYFYYDNWSPFQKQYTADTLQPEVVKLLEHWYDGNFTKTPHPQPILGNIYEKQDGNRKITVYNNIDSRKVEVVFEDLIQAD